MPPPPSKRRKTSAIQEVVFDPAARQEYLTGFHKRKVARTKHAQEIAARREKEEKRRDKDELRRKRQQNLEEHVKAVNDSMNIINGTYDEISGEEGGAIDDGEHNNVLSDEAQISGKGEEYVDEDQYATVTVEAVDITRDGMAAHSTSDEEEERDHGMNEDKSAKAEVVKAPWSKGQKGQKRPWSKNNAVYEKPKRKKSRNFKYESKEDRKLNRVRARAKHKVHAEARKSRKS